MKLKTNLDKISPKVAEYKLPSGGLFYTLEKKDAEGSDKFPNTIKIKPYGFEMEAILVTNLPSTTKMVEIIKSVAELPNGFDPQDLFVSDQHMILAIARALTYGEKYNFSSTCPECGYVEKHSLTVPDEVPCKMWVEEEKKNDPSLVPISRFTFRLPVCQDTVEIKYLTIRDNEKANSYAEAKKEIVRSHDAGYIRRVTMHIKSINGETVGQNDLDLVERDFIMKLRGHDFAELKRQIDANSCGIIQNWDIACNKCGHKYSAYIPILNNFFR